MQYINVKPSPGLKILQPENGYRVMPAAGALVPNNPHYRYLITEGSIEVIDPNAPAPKPPERPPAPPAQPQPVNSLVPGAQTSEPKGS